MLDFVIIIDIWTNTEESFWHLLKFNKQTPLGTPRGASVVLLANLQIEDCPEITKLLMLLECVIPEIMQGIQIRRMYCIRQSCNKSQAYHSQRWPKEICATKILFNAWLWRSNFENTVSHSAPAKPLSNLKSDFV